MFGFFKKGKIKRSKEILKVFFKYGLDFLVDKAEIGFLTKLRGRADKYEKLTQPKRLRLALEELGPTFIKFGQILSTRPDLLPPDFIEELEKLQDKAAFFDSEEAVSIIEQELGKEMDQVFAEFDKEPVAAASLSQVHRAKLHSGEEVAVKVQRPNIQEKIRLDIEILENIAGSLEKRVHKGWVYRPKLMVEEFRRTILKEINFKNEAHNLEKFKENIKNIDYAEVPGVFWDLTSEKVIVMDFVDGVKVSSIVDSQKNKYNKKKIAKRGAKLMLKQIYEDGFFHADPHPANLFVRSPAHIIMLDVGMVGYLDDTTKLEALRLLDAVLSSNPEAAIRSFKRLGAINGEFDSRMLKQDLLEMFNRYVDIPIKRFSFSEMNQDMLNIMSRHNLTLPPNLSLMLKSVSVIESVGRQLDPDFNLAEVARPYVRELLASKYGPEEFFKAGKEFAKDTSELAQHLPKDTIEILHQLKEGKFDINMNIKNLQELDYEIDHASNQLSFSLVVAAIIVGSALIMQQNIGPTIFGYPALGVFGFVVSSMFGLVLVVSILTSSRRM